MPSANRPRSPKPSESPLLVIAGPTASGKSALAVSAARRLGGEIVNCDSMQLIRGMDVGTAKPTPAERAAAPHHLYDLIDPDQRYSAGRYMHEARAVCREIASRGKVPIVVGGTGLYLRALLEGLFEGPGRDPELRRRLRRIAQRRGDPALHRMLARHDPKAASRIAAGDRIRVIRALEVHFASGTTITSLQPRRVALEGFRVFKAALELPRPLLYERINRRVRAMFAHGLPEEVLSLLERGFAPDCKGFEALGYRHALALVQGLIGLEEAIELTARDTRRYAKRQMTWFRKERDVHWIAGPGERPEALDELLSHAGPFCG